MEDGEISFPYPFYIIGNRLRPLGNEGADMNLSTIHC